MGERTNDETRTERRRSWRKALGAGAALAIGLVSTVVVAEWLANGSGEGYARATVAEPLTTESAEPSGTLYPGSTGDLVLIIKNPNPFPVTVTSVTQDGEITSDVAECDTAGHGVTFSPQTVSLAVPASSAQTFTLTGALAMATSSADACQGALFTIPVSLNGGTGGSDGGGSDGGSDGGGEPLDCDDGDPSTIDTYDSSTSSCSHEPMPCDDGNPSTTDAWEAGVCTSRYTYYADADGDGYGADFMPISVVDSTPPENYADNAYDCDDSESSVYPGAPEIIGNRVDDDCDGNVD